ncbi:cobalamin biosynthesis protein [Nocardia sp. NPDC059240]|uniref:cobalamin biosynthesis protein n=1 Tax=Nocardia sp. NPDC059240 TaxID=3346786 RepID=UPI00368E7C01
MVGVGFRPGASADDIIGAIQAQVWSGAIRRLATLDRRAVEPGFIDAAERLGVEAIGFSAEELSQAAVPNPSPQVAAATRTGSVAEAAAVLASGGGELVLSKTITSGIVIAAAIIGEH